MLNHVYFSFILPVTISGSEERKIQSLSVHWGLVPGLAVENKVFRCSSPTVGQLSVFVVPYPQNQPTEDHIVL